MRYFLLYHSGRYFIQEGNKPGILAAAFFPLCVPVTSIESDNEQLAMKALLLAGYLHHRKLKTGRKLAGKPFTETYTATGQP